MRLLACLAAQQLCSVSCGMHWQQFRSDIEAASSSLGAAALDGRDLLQSEYSGNKGMSACMPRGCDESYMCTGRAYESLPQSREMDNPTVGPMSPLSSGRTPRSIQAASSEDVLQLMRVIWGARLTSHLQPCCLLRFLALAS